MNVRRKKILVDDIGSGTTININLSKRFFPIDNSELIEKKFINDEIEKTINPITDYKKIMFKPCDDEWNIIDNFKINLNFFKPNIIPFSPPEYHTNINNNTNGPGVYSDIGFVYDDLFCRTNRFIFSFVRLLFFDKPISGDNKLLFFSDIYTQIGEEQINSETKLPFPPVESPITFNCNNPSKFDETFAGYYIYFFKDIVDNSPNMEFETYMTLIFNNAINGKSESLSSVKTNNSQSVLLSDLNGENGRLYLKVILKNDNGVYKYRFVPNNIQKVTNGGGINMSPQTNSKNLTFWQINSE